MAVKDADGINICIKDKQKARQKGVFTGNGHEVVVYLELG